jgi:murein tripeptide amidase MpaA
MHIINAGQSSYPEAWQGYKACASYDLQHWFRVQSTSYDPQTGALTISHTPEHSCVRYAYFAPYSLERHAALIARMQVRCASQVRGDIGRKCSEI